MVEQLRPNPDRLAAQEQLLEDAAEDTFYDRIEALDSTTKETARFREILSHAENSGRFREALDRLAAFQEKRSAFLNRIDTFGSHPEHRICQEDAQRELQDIMQVASTPEAFLGDGAVAEVFSMESVRPEQRICVKLIYSEHMYKKGNSVRREMQFLDALADLEVAGVRSPIPFYAFSSSKGTGIVMEQLPAISLSMAMQRNAFPEAFDPETFFERVSQYIDAMHERGVFHRDLFPRNIMIDLETGNPYVIDFGKAANGGEFDKTNLQQTDPRDADLITLDSSKKEVLEWLRTNAATAA